MYVFITVHVQSVGVCWCVCAIGVAIFVSCPCVRALLCAQASREYVSRIRVQALLIISSLNTAANITSSVNNVTINILH
jgi:hypothetical protein